MYLKTKLKLILIFLCICVCVFFFSADYMITEAKEIKMKNDAIALAYTIMPDYINGNIESLLTTTSQFGFTEQTSIPNNARIIYNKLEGMSQVKIFINQKNIGFCFKFLGNTLILSRAVELNFWDEYKYLFLALEITIILLLGFFIFYQVLKPLNKLYLAINELSRGVYGNMMCVKNNDEIGNLIRSFNAMNDKISKMIKSRELITRNIAHELKTPLAKIKLALSVKEGEELKRDLNKYANSLEMITSKMIEYEKLQEISQNTKNMKYDTNLILKQENFLTETLLFEAIKYLDSREDIKISIADNANICGDLNLLSIAIKNLIENAIKYSPNHSVYIEALSDEIKFINEGSPLKQDISYYFEPFFRGDILCSGYGLGLSLVKEILNLHRMTIEYYYLDNKHIFSIKNINKRVNGAK